MDITLEWPAYISKFIKFGSFFLFFFFAFIAHTKIRKCKITTNTHYKGIFKIIIYCVCQNTVKKWFLHDGHHSGVTIINLYISFVLTCLFSCSRLHLMLHTNKDKSVHQIVLSYIGTNCTPITHFNFFFPRDWNRWTLHKHHFPRTKTRHSVEHCTPHTDGARLHFTGLSYRLQNDKVVPVTWQSRKR